jgi:glutamine synthetase
MRNIVDSSFARYALDDIGSGSHVHLSLYQNGENVFMATGGTSQYGMSTVGQEFMAGVLYHLPAILAFTAPLPNRYLLVHMMLYGLM